jgi:hypothetical protein
MRYLVEYAKRLNSFDLGLIALCLSGLGLMTGLVLPKKRKKKAMFVAFSFFACALAPLMLKYKGIADEYNDQYR